MNIALQNIDEQNALLRMQINKEDYEERVTTVLKDYRRKSNLPGFRPGNVPFSIIKKLYYKAVLVDEINKLISEKIDEYLKAENIQILGEPLPNETENKPIDWENDTEFEFVFDIGISPAIEINIGKKNKIKTYDIELNDSMIDGYINTYTQRFGRYIETDVVNGNELIKSDLIQIDSEGKQIENPIKVEDTSIYLDLAKDENEKKAFIGAKVGDVVKVDIKKVFPNEREAANILKIAAEKVANLDSVFQCTVKSVLRFEKAEINQDLFNKIYGENTITSLDEFKNKITDEINGSLKQESDNRFHIDAREFLLNKINFELPVAFLKRWIKVVNSNKLSEEQIEKEFPNFEKNMKWQLIKNKIIKDNNFEVKEDEVVEYAKEITRNQFKMYGLYNIPDEQIDTYSVSLLKKENEVHNIYELLREKQVIEYIKEQVSIEAKQISREEFSKLYT